MPKRVHRHRPTPWGDRSWPSVAMPAQAVPGAAIAEPGTVPDNLRCFQVGVAPRRRGGYEAFVKFCADWPELCVHGISATSGAEAKALGIAEHIRVCIQQGKVKVNA